MQWLIWCVAAACWVLWLTEWRARKNRERQIRDRNEYILKQARRARELRHELDTAEWRIGCLERELDETRGHLSPQAVA